MPFALSASCKNLDLPPVNLRFLQLRLAQNSLLSLPPHLISVSLKEVGVVLSKEQVVELTNLLVQFNNTSRLWCNRGWTPSELAEQTSKSGPISMSFGPGLMQAFADGTIN